MEKTKTLNPLYLNTLAGRLQKQFIGEIESWNEYQKAKETKSSKPEDGSEDLCIFEKDLYIFAVGYAQKTRFRSLTIAFKRMSQHITSHQEWVKFVAKTLSGDLDKQIRLNYTTRASKIYGQRNGAVALYEYLPFIPFDQFSTVNEAITLPARVLKNTPQATREIRRFFVTITTRPPLLAPQRVPFSELFTDS